MYKIEIYISEKAKKQFRDHNQDILKIDPVFFEFSALKNH